MSTFFGEGPALNGRQYSPFLKWPISMPSSPSFDAWPSLQGHSPALCMTPLARARTLGTAVAIAFLASLLRLRNKNKTKSWCAGIWPDRSGTPARPRGRGNRRRGWRASLWRLRCWSTHCLSCRVQVSTDSQCQWPFATLLEVLLCEVTEELLVGT